MLFFCNLNGEGTIIKPFYSHYGCCICGWPHHQHSQSILLRWLQLTNQQVNTTPIFIRTGRTEYQVCLLPTADTLGGVQLPFQESSQDWNTCYFYEAILFTNFPLSQLCEGVFHVVAATFTFLLHVHKGRVIALSVGQFVHGVSVDTKLHSLSELGTLATFSFNG